LTSKIQKEGSVMLAICRAETVSLYLGETQVAAPQGNAFLAITAGVIGTVYPLKGSYGCGDPESVQQYNGEVFFYNRYKGCVVQYSDNGLEQVSKYGTRTYWKKFSDQYNSFTQEEIEQMGSRPFVIGGFDPFNEEYLLTVPFVGGGSGTILPGGLPLDPANLFDIWDGASKTMAFKVEQNKWVPAFSYIAEGFLSAENKVFAFSRGAGHRMYDPLAGYNTFFGEYVSSMIMFPGNVLPNSPKQLLAINVEVDAFPDVAYIYATYPNEQITDIQTNEWDELEGVYYAPVKRDRLTPGIGSYDLALNIGSNILANAPLIQLNFKPLGPFNLQYVNLGYKVSSGHKTIATQ
jgi:hypothetical protein